MKTIQLKYNINDMVWFMSNNKACSAKIANWRIEGNNGAKPIITYFLYISSPGNNGFIEELLFTSKENLLNSL